MLKRGSLDGTAPFASAEGLLATARARATEVIAAAEAEAGRLRATVAEEVRLARLAGAKEGHAEGMARAAAALAMAAEAREARLAELDGAVVEVALEIAHRLVGRELSTTADSVLGVARRALRAAAGCGDIVLRVASGDLARVRAASDALAQLVERGSLAVAEDPTLQAGEVIVESAGGRVDARIGAQLDAFRRALQGEGR